MQHRGRISHRLFRVKHWVELFIHHVNLQQSFFSQVGRRRRDGGHLVPHEQHLVPGQHRMVPQQAANPTVGQVAASNHGVHAGHFPGAGGVDANDASVGVGAAQDFAPQHPGAIDVGSVQRLSRDFVRAFCPGYRLANHRIGRHLSTPWQFSGFLIAG